MILLVDDEPAITESLAFAFERAGMDTCTAASLMAADQALQSYSPDLVVLDLMLPDGHGLDWLRHLRTHSKVPVIVLSSHDDPVDQIVGLEVGADDYVGKPFSPRAVIARVRAVLRRLEDRAPTEDSSIRVDLEKRRIWAGDIELLHLSRTEFDLLALFATHPGRVYERDTILNQVWGPGVAVTERTVDVHIKSLRKKLLAAGIYDEVVETVRGVGYRMSEQ